MVSSAGEHFVFHSNMFSLCGDRLANDAMVSLEPAHIDYMELPKETLLLRIFVEEADEYEGQPLFSTIVLKAREMQLAGATVLRGPLGFGRSSQLHSGNIFRLSNDVPIVIEIVDSEQKIQEFLAAVEPLVSAELITLERVRAIFYKGIIT
jgi:PII-like signaling protein